MTRLSAGHLNSFTMEWPPKSGKRQKFAQIDRAEPFDLAMAGKKINAGQEGLLDELPAILENQRK